MGRQGLVKANGRHHAGSDNILSVSISLRRQQHIQLYDDGLLGPFSSSAAYGGHGTASDGPLCAPLAGLIGMRYIDKGKA